MSEPVPDLPPMTFDEFLAWEDSVEERHEFVDGVVYAMSGPTSPHNTIVMNVSALLWNAAYHGTCRHVERHWRDAAHAPWEREDRTAADGHVPVPCPVEGTLAFDQLYRLTNVPDHPPLRRVREGLVVDAVSESA